VDIWEEFSQVPDLSHLGSLVRKRHLFNMTCNKQLVLGMKSLDFKVGPDFVQVMKTRARACIQTQIIEDINGVQKNSSAGHGQAKFKKPETSMATAISARVLDDRHSFGTVPLQSPLGCKTVRLPKDAFSPAKEERSLPLADIASNQQTPSWWSPSAQNSTITSADLALLRHCKQRGDWKELDLAWLGMVCDMSRKVVVRMPWPGNGEESWFIALTHFTNSSVAAWPVHLRSFGGTEWHWLELRTDFVEPVLLTITDIDNTNAISFEWKSWLWQISNVGSAAALKPAIRACCFRQPEPLKGVASRSLKLLCGCSLPIFAFPLLRARLCLTHCSSCFRKC
jgi:hypothetical protein